MVCRKDYSGLQAWKDKEKDKWKFLESYRVLDIFWEDFFFKVGFSWETHGGYYGV